ncbi:putative quinol monooxygenase [Rhizobium multihospitium]|uniref:Quinol monooxygenase YgiN n=1 Tax=Rhizobium multihospitium TaxID=410764 RepID=A0A1C3XDE9_9HYPH|nr:antibiotic biosynthesis monooxygenase family protein [Rhizobium multihospitium]SCB50261.1 Quinol monooxygenase YgiN [Rhizobium multihospitium]
MSYIVVARWVAKKEHQGDIERILQEFVPQCLTEPGCRSFVAHQSVERPQEFLLYEHYGEEKDFTDHQATSHFKELVLQRAVPLLESRERVPYRILA